MFITFLSLRFFVMRRERQFLSYLTFQSESTTCGTPPQTTSQASASSENRLASISPNLNSLFFFQIPKCSAHPFWAWRNPCPRFHFQFWVFYCDICDCHIRPERAWTPALNVRTYLTYALSRNVLSLTKPKGKIYKMKNDNIKNSPAII